MHQYVENDVQYKITSEWMQRFQTERAEAESLPGYAKLHPLLQKAYLESLDSMISEMSAALEAYQSRQTR